MTSHTITIIPYAYQINVDPEGQVPIQVWRINLDTNVPKFVCEEDLPEEVKRKVENLRLTNNYQL